MPSIITRGAASALALGLFAASGPSFVGIGKFLANTQVVLPASAAAGDLCILHLAYLNNAASDTLTGLSGWNNLVSLTTTNPGSGSQGSRIYWKILSSGDITTPPTVGGLGGAGGCMSIVYRKVTSVATIGANTHSGQTDSTLVLTGTKTGASKGTVVLVADRDNGSITGSANNGFSYIGSSYTSEPYWSTYAFDNLNSPSTWASGSNITCSGFLTTFEQMGIVLELR